MLYIYQVGTFPVEVVVRYAFLTALGVSSGLFTRLILSKYTGVLRFLTALFAVIVALWVAEWVTGGYIGMKVIDLNHPYPDYASLIEMGTPWLTAVLTLRAWKKRPQKVMTVKEEPVQKPLPPPIPASTKVKPVHLHELKKRQINLRGVFTPVSRRLKSWTERAKGLPGKLNENGAHVNIGRPVASEPMVITPPPIKPEVVSTSNRLAVKAKRKSQRIKDDDNVKLVGAEEHRCPFCLEEIDLNDPRGVKVCHICKTYHHADCWDVTGMCQVPHHQD
jgi:hypothetical protein